ncbi:DUF1292 domain-containing protein [Haloimpatiens sp. FM7330]|uniref:DUF1292 domain-containing protein n=1 Tax=Haloimpatiens sp. FM7330 TaxID=3298610 RepID=UPI0036342B50
MNKIAEYTEREKKVYGKLYSDIVYAVDNISDFVEKDKLKTRKYVSKLPIVKEYIELIDTANREADKKGILDVFRSDEKYKRLLEDYKKRNKNDFKQLMDCSKCMCLNCSAECGFDSCIGCVQDSRVKYCDHEKVNFTVYDNFTLNLTNNNTGEDSTYKVLGIVHNLELDKRYIIIENINDEDDKYILYYYPGISEDQYGEIENKEELDYVISLYNAYGD